VTPSDIKTHKM